MKRALACLLCFAWLAACGRGNLPPPDQAAPTATPSPGPLASPSPVPAPTRSGQEVQAGRGQASPSPTPTPLQPSPSPNPLACLPPDPPQIAQVLWAASGDSLVVSLEGRQRSVRYLGVIAPPYIPNIRFTGPPAYLKNRELAEGQVVELYRDGPDTDDQGQLLRYVVTHGLFINLELARLGLAQTNAETGLACAESLRQAQQTAQAAQMGLWGQAVFAAAASATDRPTRTPANTPGRTAVASLPSLTPAASPSPATNTPIPTASATLIPGQTPSATPPPSNTPPPTETPVVPIVIQPSNTPRPTNTQAPPTSPPPGPTATTTQLDVIITDVNFEGDPSKSEADEYIEITNEGATPINLLGWRLVSENTQISFTFPSFVIQPDVICYVYTNTVEADSCVNSSFRSVQPIWDNIGGDCAQLYDSSGHQQDEYCY